MIERIDNVGIGVTDLDRALEFYGRLGFEVLEREEGTPSATVQSGGVRLWIFKGRAGAARREPGSSPSRRTSRVAPGRQA